MFLQLSRCCGPLPGGSRGSLFFDFWVIFGVMFGSIFDEFSEGRILYENQCFFEKWCFTEARASLLKVRVRFGASLERPKSLKSDLGEGQKRAPQNILKIEKQINEVCKIRTLTKCCIYHTDLMFSVLLHRYFKENMRSKSDEI